MADCGDLEEIGRRLDAIAEGLARLTEAAERGRAWNEFASEIAPSLRATHDAAQAQLAEVEPYVNREDLLHLLKHLACNAGDIIAALEQLESLRDLLADAAPLTVEASEALIERLDHLERRGYFAVTRELLAVLDGFMRELDPAAVRHWSAQVPAVVATAKELGELEVGTLVAAVVARLRAALRRRDEPPPSLWHLLARLRQPEVRRGLALGLDIVAALGAQGAGSAPPVDKKDIRAS